MRLPPWSWPGAVALVLGGCLGLGWCAALIIATASPERETEAGLNLLGALGQTIAGAVAAYLGYQIGHRTAGPGQDERTNDDDENTSDTAPGRRPGGRPDDPGRTGTDRP